MAAREQNNPTSLSFENMCHYSLPIHKVEKLTIYDTCPNHDIQEPGDIDGWSDINAEDKKIILDLIKDTLAQIETKRSATPKKSKFFLINNKIPKCFYESNFLSFLVLYAVQNWLVNLKCI